MATTTTQFETTPGLPPGWDRLAIDVATSLIQSSGDEEAGAREGLRFLANSCHADSAALCRFSQDQQQIESAIVWADENGEALERSLLQASLGDLPLLMKSVQEIVAFQCPSLSELPAEATAEREFWRENSISKAVIAPLAIEGRVMGMIVLQARDAEWELTDDLQATLDSTSPMFAAVLARAASQRASNDKDRLARRILDSNVLPIFCWEPTGKITRANKAWMALTGFSQQEIDRGCLTLRNTTPVEYHTGDKEYLQLVAEQGYGPCREKEVLRADGSRVPVLMGGASLSSDGSGVAYALDISERIATEATLRESEDRFRTLAQNVPGVVYMCRNDSRFTMLYLNRAVEELTGYPPADFINNKVSFVELYHPDDKEFIRKEVDGALAERQPFHLQYRLKRDEEWRWVEEHGQGVFSEEGRLLYLEGAVFDITDRKVAEQALRSAHQGLERRVDERTEELRDANELLLNEVAVRRKMEAALHHEKQFLKKTLDQHEADRRLTAYEIHDGLAQYVAGALMHFEAAARAYQEEVEAKAGSGQAPTGEASKEQFELGMQLLRRTIDEARRLISGLRPPILDEQGIVAAVEYLINEHADLAGLVSVEVVQPFGRLSPLLESTLFRIVQEALNNIAQHAGPDARSKITLSRVDDHIHLEIRDWGKGFDSSAVSSKAHGLRGIRERARLMGGSAAIHSKPEMGTLVSVEIPEQEDPTMRVPLRGPKS